MRKMMKAIALLCGSSAPVAIAVALVAVASFAEPAVDCVVARQRYPWNGLVDISCRVTGIEGETNGLKLAVASVMPDSGNAGTVSHVKMVKGGTNSTDCEISTNGDYRFLWDARADLGMVRYTNMVVCLTFDMREKVQLWEGGPYWAITNIGAEKPEDYGYYFWWGDTIGYRRENDSYVATDGSSSNFSFFYDKISGETYNKAPVMLESEGWVVLKCGTYVLAPEHDAAQVQWGGGWRMPTYQELKDLESNCDWTWMTRNGVNGCVVQGRGDYASASIFLPLTGYGVGTSLNYAGSHCFYWASEIYDFWGAYSRNSGALYLGLDYHSRLATSRERYEGEPVRPVRTAFAGHAGYSAPFLLDTAEGASAAFALNTDDGRLRFAGQDEPIVFSTEWDGSSSVSVTVTDPAGAESVLANGAAVCEGEMRWNPSSGAGAYLFRHVTDTNTLEATIYAVEDAVVHEGAIGGTNVWEAGDVHIVNGTVTVAADAALEIERGAVVKLAPGAMLKIAAGGVCIAEGVTFTHIADDTAGGDTLGDGGATTPEENAYTISGFVRDDLETEYRYGVNAYSGMLVGEVAWRAEKTYVIDGALTVASNGVLTIPAGTVVKFADGGSLAVKPGGVCAAAGAIFTHIADDAVGGDTNGDGGATKPEYGKYTVDAAVIDDESTEYRYSAPIQTSGTITGSVVWRARQVYRVTGNLTVASGATLDIAAGTVIKFDGGVSLTVNGGGTLNAKGTRSAPVVFTSIKDDSHGGDTNGDGAATHPEGGDWFGMWVYGKANLEYATLMYGGPSNERGLVQTSGSGNVRMTGCVLTHSKYDGVWNWGGTISLENSVITDVGAAICSYNGTITCLNCVVYGVDYGYWYDHMTMRNCILANCTRGFLDTRWFNGRETISNTVFWNPAEETTWPQSFKWGGTNGNVWGDPLFVNPDNGDFRIAADSPCVDAGDGTAALEKDYYNQPRRTIVGVESKGTANADGAIPDIGIYEVQPREVASDVDLAVEGVSAPASLVVGEKTTVAWTVKNLGSETAVGPWVDVVELVCANGAVVELGRLAVGGTIPPGGVRTLTGSWTVPSAQAGAVRVRVTANAGRDLFEGSLTANNVAESVTTSVTLPELASGGADGAASFRIAAGGAAAFRLGAGFADGGLLIVRTTGGAAGGVGVWTGNGQVPTADIYYAAGVSVADGVSIVRVPAGGDAYVAFENAGGSLANVEVEAETGAFLLFDTGRVTAPNSGSVSLTLYGNGFSDDMEVWLAGRPNAPTIAAADLAVFSPVHAVATFDVTGLDAGAYEVRVKKGGVDAAAPLLTLTETRQGPKWSCRLDVASAIRSSREYVGYLEYANSGDMPLDAPYVKITAGDGSFIRFGTADAWGDTLEMMAVSATYPASKLKPGETRRIPFRYKTTASALSIECGYTQSDASAFPWDTNAAYMRPSWAGDELWGLSLAVLKANVGATWDDYLARMRANCDHLAKIGQPTHRLDRIWQLEINEALGVDHAVSTLASNTDLARSGRGFGLALSRSYGSGLYRRLRKGVFGYGWSDNYGAYAELQNSGATLALHSGGGSTYLFEKVNGKWTPEDARDKTTCTETSSEYVLKYRSGTEQRIAKSNMRVSSVKDNQGNSLSFTYNADGTLAQVVHGDGQTLSFSYSGGLLVSATDDQGRATRYEYTGDLLVKVTAFNGLSTEYRYLPADASVTSRALRQIRYADGTTRDYAYDGAGRVASVSVNGSLQTVEIVRGALGSYSVIAPNGGETTVTLGASGEVLETVNALGQKSTRAYTADTLLEAVVGPTGKRAKIAYDADGQAVKATDAAGAETSFAYTSDFGNLAKVTDARGNAFDYGYDALGRSKSISYADGSVESIAYDERGNVVRSVNRRGQSIAFTYDAEGNTLSKVWEDGRTFTWAYDAKGNCTNATDSATGAVTMEYDGNERLTRIVHPGGRGFAYEYDALGRTVKRTMLVGRDAPIAPSPADIQKYEYDSLGRLSRMTDGDGNLYVENAYDPVTGWLVTQTYGNGTVVSNAYDILGRTVGIYHLVGRVAPNAPQEVLAFFEYAYDAEGRRISQTTAEGVERYAYDTVGQLTDVYYPDGTEEHFTYDAVGNRTGRTGILPVQEESYTANNLNQYTEIGRADCPQSAVDDEGRRVEGNAPYQTLAYDLDGNLVSKTTADGDTTRYFYDIQNRLVAVTNETADIAWSCEYDVFGNRTKVIDHGKATESLFVQGSLASSAAEFDASGVLATRHILTGSVRIADWESRHLGGGEDSVRYYHADGLASTRLLTDANGSPVATASYTAFGSIRTGRDALVASGVSAGWVGTLGVERDPTGLVFMRNRYYDAEQGRFIQMDPIGQMAGDVNWYRYCGNVVTEKVDLNGLETTCKSFGPWYCNDWSRDEHGNLRHGPFEKYLDLGRWFDEIGSNSNNGVYNGGGQSRSTGMPSNGGESVKDWMSDHMNWTWLYEVDNVANTGIFDYADANGYSPYDCYEDHKSTCNFPNGTRRKWREAVYRETGGYIYRDGGYRDR